MSGTCDSVGKLLSPYVDDQLSGPERQALEGHVQGCTGCRGRLEDLRAARALLSAHLESQLAAIDFSSFNRRVIEAVRREPLPLRQRLRLWWAELMSYHSMAIYSGLGTAAAVGVAALVLVTRPAASPTSNEMVVHSLEVSNPNYEPVVMHTDDGETVIMLVQHQDDGDEESEPAQPALQAPAKTPVAEEPHQGNL